MDLWFGIPQFARSTATSSVNLKAKPPAGALQYSQKCFFCETQNSVMPQKVHLENGVLV